MRSLAVFIFTSFVSLFAVAQTDYDNNSYNVGQVGLCAVRIMGNTSASAEDAQKVTEIIEKLRRSYGGAEQTKIALAECQAIAGKLSKLSPKETLERQMKNNTYYDFTLYKIMRSIVSIGDEKVFQGELDAGVKAAEASKETRFIAESFYRPTHWCGQAQVSAIAGVVNGAAKLGVSLCISTTGAQWIEANPGLGFSVGGQQVHIGGGEFRDEGTGAIFQVTRSIVEGRAAGTAGTGERRCRLNEACEYGNLSDLIYRNDVKDQEIIGVGAGWAPAGSSAKLYNLRMKLIPLPAATTTLGNYILSGRF